MRIMMKLLRTNRDLRWLFIAQVISFMGDWFSFVALTRPVMLRLRAEEAAAAETVKV